MYKIKIFSQDNYLVKLGKKGLDAQFNEWVKKNPEMDVIDLQYQVENGVQYLCVGYDDYNFKDEGVPVEQ